MQAIVPGLLELPARAWSVKVDRTEDSLTDFTLQRFTAWGSAIGALHTAQERG
jgi:hypothetical protein